MLSDQPQLELQLLGGRSEAGKREATTSPEEPSVYKKHEVMVYNDLPVAIEVNPGTAWRVLYPDRGDRFESLLLEVAVRLREEHDIYHSCSVVGVGSLRASEAFGDHGPTAVEFIETEQKKVKHEDQVREERSENLRETVRQHRMHSMRKFAKHVGLPFLLLVLFIMVQPGGNLAAGLLSFGAVVSFCYLGWWTDELHDDCEARSNAEAKLFGAGKQRCSYLFMSKFARIVYILASALLAAMIVRHCINGFPWVALILGLPSICCCWFFASMEKHFKDTKAGVTFLKETPLCLKARFGPAVHVFALGRANTNLPGMPSCSPAAKGT